MRTSEYLRLFGLKRVGLEHVGLRHIGLKCFGLKRFGLKRFGLRRGEFIVQLASSARARPRLTSHKQLCRFGSSMRRQVAIND